MWILSNLKIVSILLISATIAYLLIWVILKTTLINFFRDRPGLRKVHQRIIPRIGGIAILTGFLVLICVWHFLLHGLPQLPSELLSALTFAAVAIMLVGLVDDMVIFHIHNKAKFILEVLIATEIVLFNGIQLNHIYFLGWHCTLGWVGIPITVLWIVGVTNAINIIDGVDGLAGSVMAVVFTTIAILTGFSGDTSLLILCIILAGLVGGFLLHNVSPARVFLGDAGSLFLGVMTGVLSIYLVSKDHSNYPLLIAPLMVGLPVLDVFVAMGRRYLKKVLIGAHWINAFKAMSVADNEHMHHRLIYRGLTHTETVFILVVFHAVICMSAIIIKFTNIWQSITILTYISVLFVWFLYKLHFFDRFTMFLRNGADGNQSRKIMIAVVNAEEVLKFSLQKYKQDIYSLVFKNTDEILNDTTRYGAIVIEQVSGTKVENAVSLASALFMQNACPVIVIASGNEKLPENLQFPDPEQSSYLLVKKPVYVPVIFREVSRLIRLSRSWSMGKVTEDTRQFFLQAVVNEKF